MADEDYRLPTLDELAACGVAVLRREQVSVRVPCYTSKGVIMESDTETRDFFAPGVQMSSPDVCFYYGMTQGTPTVAFGIPRTQREEWIQTRISHHAMVKPRRVSPSM